MFPGGAFAGGAIEPADADNLKLDFAVLADAHIETNTLFRMQFLRGALRDLGKVKSDALVLLGDNTMNGQFLEYMMLYGIVNRWNTAANTLAAIGNHDINPDVRDLGAAIARHNLFYNGYTGAKNDKVYYSKEINGYSFIVMGSEYTVSGEDWTRSYISPEQIAWLDAALAKANESGKPAFVFHHQPLSYTDPRDDVFAVLKKYKNVVYFSGHMHTPASLETLEGVTLVNTPLFSDERGGSKGFYVEVYEGEVLIRVREFFNGKWAPGEPFKIVL